MCSQLLKMLAAAMAIQLSLSACSSGVAQPPTSSITELPSMIVPSAPDPPDEAVTSEAPDPEPVESSAWDDGAGGWVDEVDGICGDAIADYQEAKRTVRNGDPVALQVAAAVATSRAVSRVAAVGAPPTTESARLATALAAFANAERLLAIAWDKGQFDTTEEDARLEQAGATLTRAAGVSGADACAQWAQRL